MSSKENPAVDASSGFNPIKFIQKIWMHTPGFLWKAEGSWSTDTQLLSQHDPELKKDGVFTSENPKHHPISYFSNWTRLLRAIAWYFQMKGALMLIVRKRKEWFSAHVTTRSSSQKVSV